MLGRGIVTRVGDAILFGPAHPPGLRVAGAAGRPFADLDREHEPPSKSSDNTIFLSLDLRWTPALERLLGVVVHKHSTGQAPAEIIELAGASAL